jgi:hypothetical protein
MSVASEEIGNCVQHPTCSDERKQVEMRPKLVEDAGIGLFTDQYDSECVRIPVANHFEMHPLRSKAFRHWIVRYHMRKGKSISKRGVNECIAQLEAVAGEEKRELGNRSKWSEDRKTLHIDLSDERWRIIGLGMDGWSIDEQPPAVFRRFKHQKPLPEPDASGDIKDLLTFLPPLPSELDRLLLLTWAVIALVPIPRPILCLIGPHGSAKSTLSAFLQRLLDPSRVESLGKDARADLPLLFFRHAVPVFDNMDGMSASEADLFCQAVTGRGITRRKLYTDADEFILSFQRAIIVNGLSLPTNRPDFLDRSLILDFERLSAEQRRVLEHVEADFMEARPRLLGGLLNTLSQALARLPAIGSEGLSRMADFHRLGRAVAEVLGYSSQQFDDAMRVVEARQKRGAFDNTLALAVLHFARQAGHWQGEATDLLQRLQETAKANQIRQSPEFWPATPMGLGRQLKHLNEALARKGVRITRLRRSATRLIALEYDPAGDSIGDDD